jgi:acetyl esterase/lipase
MRLQVDTLRNAAMPFLRTLLCLALLLAAAPAPATTRQDLGDLVAERNRRAEKLPDSTRVLRNYAYGPDARQKLDVYRADGPVRDAPVIVMVHGGGWITGDKALTGVVGAKAVRWLDRGFLFVSVNYRFVPNVDVPAQADDVARALAVVQAKARDWGGDPERIVLMGHSAGGHLVALLAADPARWRATGLKPWLGTVSLDSGVYDIEALMRQRHFALYDTAFGGDPATWTAISPTAALRPDATPLLAVCSRGRLDGSCAHARAYADRARALGVRVEVLPEPLSHGDINGQLGYPSSYTTAVEHFMGTLDAEVARRLAK